MEVRPGFKRTAFGEIPSDWDFRSICDEVDLLTGYPFPSAQYVDAGIRLLRGSNVKRGSTDWAEEITQYWPAITSEVAKYELQLGDLVIAMDGSLVGRSFARLKSNDLPAMLLQRVARVRSRTLDIGYLTAFVSSDWFARYVDSVKTVTAIPHISPSDIQGFSIPIPPTIEEQRTVASALSDVDALLSGLDRLIGKKRDLKQAAMQQLLTGQTRLPGFEEEWEVKKLGLVLTFQVGYPFSSAYFNDKEQGLRLIKNRDLKSDDQMFHYSGNYDPAFLVRDGDVLVGMDGDFLPCRWHKGPALLNQRVGRIRPLEGLVKAFAYYYLIGPLKEIEVATACTTVKHLSHGDIEGIEKPLPSTLEQTVIATVLSDMDAELAALEARRDKTRLFKQGMMQELLTGKTRLIAPEAAHV